MDLRSGRCIATRIDLSFYPVGHEEASQPRRARHDRPVRPDDGRHAEKKREAEARERRSHETWRGGCWRVAEKHAGRQMRRRTEKEDTKRKNERDAERESEERQRKKRGIEERKKGGEARKMSRNRHGRTKNDRKYRAERRKMCAQKATSEIRVPLFHFDVSNEVCSTRRSLFRASSASFFAP